MEPYADNSSYEATGSFGRCSHRGCPYPGFSITILDHYRCDLIRKMTCWPHFIINQMPFSMEYEDADALCGVPHHRRMFGGTNASGKARRLSKDAGLLMYQNLKWGTLPFHSHTSGSGYSEIRTVRSQRASGKEAAMATARFEANRDAARKAFDELFRPPLDTSTHIADSLQLSSQPDTAYSLCGEKVPAEKIVMAMPGCDVCRKMLIAERVARFRTDNPPEIRLRMETPPTPKEDRLSFEEMIESGMMGFDDESFANRRNWGERSGRVWNDRSRGVQRDHRLRVDRGGVNRKRG